MPRLPRSRAAAIRLAALALLASLAAPTAAVAAPRGAVPRTAVIERIELVEVAPGARLEIAVDRELAWTLGRDGEGRLTIDLPNARPGLGVVSRVVAGGLVAEIRLQSVGVPSRPVTRLVVATREAADHRVAADRSRLRVDLVPTGLEFPIGVPAPAPPAPRPAAEPPRTAVRDVGLLPVGELPAPAAVEPTAANAPLVVEPPPPPSAVEIAPTDLESAVSAAPPTATVEAAAPAPPLAERPFAPLPALTPTPPAPLEVAPPPLQIASPSPPSAEPVPRLAPPARGAIEPLPAAPAPPLAPSPLVPPPLRDVATELHSIARLAAGVLAVAGDGAFDYTGFRLEAPERFVLDLHGVRNRIAEGVLPIDEGVLVQVRVMQYRLAPAPVTRVIFDLRTPTLPAIEPAADGLLVRFPAAPPGAPPRPDASPFG